MVALGWDLATCLGPNQVGVLVILGKAGPHSHWPSNTQGAQGICWNTYLNPKEIHGLRNCPWPGGDGKALGPAREVGGRHRVVGREVMG